MRCGSEAEPSAIGCAREFACEACLRRRRPGLLRVVALILAWSFNDIVDMDIYHVKFAGERYLVLALLDEFTRYEVDQGLAQESLGQVTKLLVKRWINVFGSMCILRADMAGARISELRARTAASTQWSRRRP